MSAQIFSVILVVLAGVATWLMYMNYRKIKRKNLELEEVSEAFTTTSGLAFNERTRADKAKSAQEEFFGAAVHELRTPLTIIHGNIGFLLDNWEYIDEEKKIEHIKSAHDGSKMMDKAIDSSMKVIRDNLEGWRADCVKVEDIDHTVSTILENLSLKHNNIEYWHNPISTPVLVDEGVLTKIVAELVENAHNHGFDDSPIVVTLSELRRSVELSVSGTGPANGECLTSSCFERGKKGKSSSGSGFGLWIVKNHAQSISGDIDVKQFTRGEKRVTTFSLAIPKEPTTATIRRASESFGAASR